MRTTAKLGELATAIATSSHKPVHKYTNGYSGDGQMQTTCGASIKCGLFLGEEDLTTRRLIESSSKIKAGQDCKSDERIRAWSSFVSPFRLADRRLSYATAGAKAQAQCTHCRLL